MGHNRNRIFLKIICWQPVVFGSHESLKEAPGATSYQPREAKIIARQSRGLRRRWTAYPVSHKRREEPGKNERPGNSGCRWLQKLHQQYGNERKENGRKHQSQKHSQIVTSFPLCLSRCYPFEQPAT